jgi:hypothetical protein
MLLSREVFNMYMFPRVRLYNVRNGPELVIYLQMLKQKHQMDSKLYPYLPVLRAYKLRNCIS